ncbi:MAG: GFA family protein [Pseudomonadota bacterium]
MSWSGGCQCGAVRYQVEGELGRASICHCRMCQKALAGPFGAFVTVDAAKTTWTGERGLFQSSNKIRRGFCRDCGTPLTFESDKTLDITIFSFDRAAEIEPVIQLEPQSGPAWVRHFEGLEVLVAPPGYLEGITSNQHPDNDA